jgi:hypothetical protein
MAAHCPKPFSSHLRNFCEDSLFPIFLVPVRGVFEKMGTNFFLLLMIVLL